MATTQMVFHYELTNIVTGEVTHMPDFNFFDIGSTLIINGEHMQVTDYATEVLDRG